MVSMRDRSWGLGARSARTCPGANTPAAKTRPSRTCLIVGMGLLRAPRVRDKRRRAGSVPATRSAGPRASVLPWRVIRVLSGSAFQALRMTRRPTDDGTSRDVVSCDARVAGRDDYLRHGIR